MFTRLVTVLNFFQMDQKSEWVQSFFLHAIQDSGQNINSTIEHWVHFILKTEGEGIYVMT